MIVVKIELWPGGFKKESRKKLLGTLLIARTKITPDRKRADYLVRMIRKHSERTATVKDYPRKAYPPDELVRRALNEIKEGGQNDV